MQITLTAASFLALVASALALQVTNPYQGSTLDLSKDNKITWASVSSDPSSFEIQLVNNAVNPSVSITIAQNVQTSAGSYNLKSVSGAAPGQGYQINLVNTAPQDMGILAQSGQFTVAAAGASTTSASFSSSTPSTSMGSSTSSMSSGSSSTMSTTTTSGSSSSSTGSSSSSGSSSGSATATSSGSATASTSAAASTGGASTLNTFAGAGALAMVAAIFA